MIKNALILLLAAALALVLWKSDFSSTPEVIEVQLAPTKAATTTTALQTLLQEASKRPGLEGAAIGFCLLDEHGEIMAEFCADTAFIPASSLKTVTTATALELFGPDFCIETLLRSSAGILEGVLAGDLVILGGADPMLSLKDLETWSAKLKRDGLKRISGRVLGDGSLLQGSIYADFWNWGDIGNGYSSAVAGLNLEHNRYVAAFRAGEAIGAPAAFLGTHPEVPDVSAVNETVTGHTDSGDGVVIHGGERTHVLHFRGTVPLGAGAFEVLGAVPDPAHFAAYHLRKALLAAGIEVAGEAAAVSGEKAEAHELLRHQSPPLKEIVTSIHATSDNHETECLFRLLGLRANKAAETVVREHWLKRGLNFTGLRMEDGCGLARADFITPKDLARLQYLAAHGPHGAVYQASLLHQNNLRWKGGAMSGVRSTTGYLTARSGREFCFAFMVNHSTNSRAVSELREALLAAAADL